jgi:hypothetical protein
MGIRAIVCVLVVLLSGPVAGGQTPAQAPLPDVATLAREVRARLEPDSVLLGQYTYKERRRDVKVSKLGKLHLGPWREFEVYPSTEPGETYKRLITVDGKPLAPEVLARRDAEHRQHVLDRQAQLAVETPAQRSKRLAKRAKELREEREAIDDLFHIYEFTVLRRDMLNGRPTLLVSLVPKPGVKPRTDAGKYLVRMQGYVWIDEADRQLVRGEMTVTRDITFGLGLLARLHTGSQVHFRRTLVNGEIWLPAEATFKTAGRALLFRKFDLQTTTYYSDYRKFDVSTSEQVVSSR